MLNRGMGEVLQSEGFALCPRLYTNAQITTPIKKKENSKVCTVHSENAPPFPVSCTSADKTVLSRHICPRHGQQLEVQGSVLGLLVGISYFQITEKSIS